MSGGAGVGIVEPPDPRNRAGQLDDAAIVDLVEHCRTADLPGRALVYCLRPPIDYIGADVVELKFGPGAETPAFVPRDWRDNGRRYQATVCRADRPRALYARAGRAAAFAGGGGGGGAGLDRLYRRQSDARGLAGYA